MNNAEEQLPPLLTQLEAVPRPELPQALLQHFKEQSGCSLEDFAIYYLAALRQNTEQHFRSGNGQETPKCQTPVRQPKPAATATLSVTATPGRLLLTPPEYERQSNESQLSNRSNLSAGNSNSSSLLLSNASTSTPTPTGKPNQRRSIGAQFSSTPTPQSANRSASGSFCLGDFLVKTPTQAQQRSKKKTTPVAAATPGSGSQDSTAEKLSKPKRRVLPMTISKNVTGSSSFGDTSSFSNENNLWRLSHSTELVDRSQGAALELEARKSLLLRQQEIKIEAPVAVAVAAAELRRQSLTLTEEENSQAGAAAAATASSFALEPFNIAEVTNARQLELLAAIYGQLMDLNLVPNVLGELSFALQLLNIREGVSSPNPEPDSSPLSALGRHNNCIYFAAQLLERQSSLLAQLDRKSLAVLLQNERLALLPKPLLEQLELTCQKKQQQSSQSCDSNSNSASSSSLIPPADSKQNVYYQHEKDSRDNFPSQNEFVAFKTQRDLFYKVFKYWELKHLNRVFSFSGEVTPKIREIFRQSEHAVNMAHFAKLFVSQLLISASELSDSPEELGLKLDQLRLNRLAQRLVTSNSSVEDQFPRTQAYFRDFVNECGSLAFLMQLKLALYAQLLRYNDSNFEAVAIEPEPDETAQQGPYVVRPSVLASMLVLAKFLGYVTALPYNQGRGEGGAASGSASATANLQQLQLRSHFQPDFDLRALLERAMRQGKLLIALPWLAQYLSMMDATTLQLSNYSSTMELLYALYAAAGQQDQPDQLEPAASFIVRSCIGWLLEAQPPLATNYYGHRSSSSNSSSGAPIRMLIKQSLDSLRVPEKSIGGCGAALLDQLLEVACPFLPEFRVAIAPSKQSQSASRSGRFRYITTRLEQFSSAKSQSPVAAAGAGAGAGAAPGPEQPSCNLALTPAEQQQRKLFDAFLHSQNASMRRLLEFVTERSFKCVVKDAQQQILLPSKAKADAEVNAIGCSQWKEVYRELNRIYGEAHQRALKDWQQLVPGMLEQRIQQSLLALLPANTNAVVGRTCAQLIRSQAQPQLQQWLQSSVQSNFYYSDLQELASKICRANKSSASSTLASSSSSSNELCLSSDTGLSQLLYELQQWLHCLSLRPEQLRCCAELLPLLERSGQAVQQPQLPTVVYYLIGSSLVRLLQLLLCRQPLLLSPELISQACQVWLAPNVTKLSTSADPQSSPGIFDALLSVSFIQELLSVNEAAFQLLQQLLLSMLSAGVLNIEFLNELFMPLLKENWSPNAWASLSQLMQHLSQLPNRSGGDARGGDEDEAKSHLFMEVLADLSRDLDF